MLASKYCYLLRICILHVWTFDPLHDLLHEQLCMVYFTLYISYRLNHKTACSFLSLFLFMNENCKWDCYLLEECTKKYLRKFNICSLFLWWTKNTIFYFLASWRWSIDTKYEQLYLEQYLEYKYDILALLFSYGLVDSEPYMTYWAGINTIHTKVYFYFQIMIIYTHCLYFSYNVLK